MMMDKLNHLGEKSAAFGTVSGASWLTYEAVTKGMNLLAAILGVISACLAIWWWLIKIGQEKSKREVEND